VLIVDRAKSCTDLREYIYSSRVSRPLLDLELSKSLASGLLCGCIFLLFLLLFLLSSLLPCSFIEYSAMGSLFSSWKKLVFC
jgi:hypothetical protein